jgi:hypothetical protein
MSARWIAGLLEAIVVSTVLLVTGSSARARDTGQEQETLKGLVRVHVVVYVEGSANSVASPVLQKDVEHALQQSGLRVISGAELKSDPNAGLLIVSVGSLEDKLSGPEQLAGYAYRTDLNLWQITTLSRASWIRTYTATWQAPMRLGTCGPDAVAVEVGKSVGGQVDQFLAAYRAANPKKKQ